MSALGQTRRFRYIRVTSAFHPIATGARRKNNWSNANLGALTTVCWFVENHDLGDKCFNVALMLEPVLPRNRGKILVYKASLIGASERLHRLIANSSAATKIIGAASSVVNQSAVK
jgi:hypothetical protein